MTQRKDTGTNPYGGRDYNGPSNMTRIGNSLRFTAPAADPIGVNDGVPVQDWKSVHVIFYGDETTSVGKVAHFRPWRWYAKQTDGHAGVSGVEVGWWIPDYEVTVALDPAMVSNTVTAHLEWPTRDAEKMYWQYLGAYDVEGNVTTDPTFVSAQPFGNATQNDAIGVMVSSAGGGGAMPDCCPAEFPFMATIKATHWSPIDGNVVYTSGNTLTASGFPFTLANDKCHVIGLFVRKVSGNIFEYVNGHNGVDISATGNIITMTGAGAAPFANTDTNYWVYIIEQEKAYESATDSYNTEEIAPLMWQAKATHWSPVDGNVTYNDPDTVAAAGFPFTIDDSNCHILALVVRKSNNAVYEYINGHNGYMLTATAGIVTLIGAGASPFAGTDLDYYLYVIEQEKAYDLSADAYRMEEIAPLNDEFTQPAYVINEPAVDSGAPNLWTNAPSADGIIADGYKDIAFQLYLIGGASNGDVDRVLTVKFQGSNDADAGSGREWVDLGVGYDLNADGTASTWVATGNTALSTLVDFDNWMHKRIRMQYMWDDDPGDNHPGAIVVTYRMKAL